MLPPLYLLMLSDVLFRFLSPLRRHFSFLSCCYYAASASITAADADARATIDLPISRRHDDFAESYFAMAPFSMMFIISTAPHTFAIHTRRYYAITAPYILCAAQRYGAAA